MILIRFSEFTFPFFGLHIQFSEIDDIVVEWITNILHAQLLPFRFLNCATAHLKCEHFSSRGRGIFLASLASSCATRQCLSLQHWGTSIEYKNWFYAEEEEFADSSEEAYDVGVSKGLAFFVTYSFEELRVRRVDQWLWLCTW
jgi:hypothetical protein